MLEAYPGEIDELLNLGLIENCTEPGFPAVLRLTQRGRLLGNQVFLRFV
jgi:hypothetical protein